MTSFTGILVAVLMVSLSVTMFMIMTTDLADNYNTTIDNDTRASLGKINRTTQIYETVSDTNEKFTNSSSGISAADLLGGFFKSGYVALLTVKDSFTTIQIMTDAGLSTLPIESRSYNAIRNTLNALVIVGIIFGIIIAILIRRDKA